MDRSRSGTDPSAEERRSETREAMRGAVSALHTDLLATREWDADAPRLQQAVAALAVQAREADVAPERLIVALKRLTDDRALAHLSFGHRRTLGERFVEWGIASYYQSDDSV